MFVSAGDRGAKKSVWLRRRIAVLREGQEMDEHDPKYVGTSDMAADAFTKNLPYPAWRRLMNYATNKTRMNKDTPVNGFGDNA